MTFQKLFTAAIAAAGLVSAAPLDKRQDSNIDVTVLQFALTLEHLENAFYKGVLEKFSEQDFMAAGYSANYYNNLKYIASDEQTHVTALSSALEAAGETPVQPCTYNFPYSDVKGFITLSSVLEGVGTSAYLGGAPLITSKDYLTVAGSILAVEALHTSYQRAALDEVPFANAFYTPLDPTSVFTLAGMFIESCPPSNPALPFQPFPSLMVEGETCTCESPECGPSASCGPNGKAKGYGKAKAANGKAKGHAEMMKTCSPPKPGDKVSLKCEKSVPAGSFVTFVSGLDVVSVAAECAGHEQVSAIIPHVASGQSYVFVTKSDVEGKFDDTQVLCGPAVLEVFPVMKE